MIGFFEAPNSSDLNVTNHILLIFKQALCKKRNCSIIPNVDYIKQKIRLAYQIEKKIATENGTLSKHLKKWDKFQRNYKVCLGWKLAYILFKL